MDIRVDKSFDGMSVLAFLRREIGVTGAMLRHLKFIDNGITVNGEHVTVRHTLREGELLSIKVEDAEPSENIEPCDIPLAIAYEDDDLVLPDKPPFMPTHPSHGHYLDTVANALAYRYREAESPFVFRPINRLDKNTSGLVLIARNRMAAGFLSSAIKNGQMHKEYTAVLEGVLPQKEGRIETYMKRTDESIIVRRVCSADEGGDLALTKYKTVFTDGRFSVVKASPVTGRTHQLRVHFSYMGCPIVGDDMYGKESGDIARHALHASRLVFPHPNGKEALDISTSPILPDDMERLVRKLFGAENYTRIIEKITEKDNK